MNSSIKLTPHLIVREAARAITFYVEVLGAREVTRYADDKLGGLIVHAELDLHGNRLTLSEEHREWHNDSPLALSGSPVVLHLDVSDADALGARMVKAGASVIFPIADQFYGKREGRLRDPFGHLWVLSQPLEQLTAEEIQRRVDAFPSTTK